MAKSIVVEALPQVDPERVHVGIEANWMLSALAEDLLARFWAEDGSADLELLGKAVLPQIVRLAHLNMAVDDDPSVSVEQLRRMLRH